ncbi:MAG: ribosome assembly RNA-binding protein YhbY [Gammaproteobacteria bacterium]|jgi:RNA-binding protein
MALTERQKRHLRGLGHGLKPVVIIGGAGLTEAVLRELALSLDHHELLKVRVNAGDRADRERMIGELCTHTGAELVQRVGHVALIFKRNRERPRVSLDG